MCALIAAKPSISNKLKIVSDYFIALSNSTGNLITNLKLQKLVYYAQSWHLAVLKQPLFPEDFEAWVHGPVIPALYNEYKGFKWTPIVREDLNENVYNEIKSNFKSSNFLELIVNEYFSMDAYALEKSTHNEDPWILARKGMALEMACNEIITKESIIDYYSQFVIKDGSEVE